MGKINNNILNKKLENTPFSFLYLATLWHSSAHLRQDSAVSHNVPYADVFYTPQHTLRTPPQPNHKLFLNIHFLQIKVRHYFWIYNSNRNQNRERMCGPWHAFVFSFRTSRLITCFYPLLLLYFHDNNNRL
jgi:hypothetical protein